MGKGENRYHGMRERNIVVHVSHYNPEELSGPKAGVGRSWGSFAVRREAPDDRG